MGGLRDVVCLLSFFVHGCSCHPFIWNLSACPSTPVGLLTCSSRIFLSLASMALLRILQQHVSHSLLPQLSSVAAFSTQVGLHG